MSWPTDPEALVGLQLELGRASPPPWRPHSDRILVAGCWICFAEHPASHGERAWAAAWLGDGRRLLASAVCAGRVAAPYEPGLLALREGPLLEAAVRALPRRPELLLVNASGRDHPRGAGLALHLGHVLELPSAGVTDRPLLATGEPPEDPRRGARAPLLLAARPVACWLRTRTAARPVVVHAGWRTDADAGARAVLACTSRARSPEPLRRARTLARLARAQARGGGGAAG